jgi:phosphohistidine phosphatase SixA
MRHGAASYHLWSKRSVERALEASGFEKISWVPLAADGAPDAEESYEEVVGVFTARLA